MVLVNPPAAELGRSHVILAASGRQHYMREFPGPLSIKSVVRGHAAWSIAGARMECGPQSYLILNQDQPYSIEVDSPATVETLCVFFRRDFVPSTGFDERLRPRKGDVALLLEGLHAGIESRKAGPGWLADQVQLLAEALVRGRIPAAKPATREHLRRCLLRGREVLDAPLASPADLDAAAREAGLAPFHFHRLFRAAFGETPHQFRTRRRLEEAARLLARTDRPVTDVCFDVGFASLGSFSALFHRVYGVPPRRYRQIRKSGEVFAIRHGA